LLSIPKSELNYFSEKEKKWIILEYGTSESPTVLRRKFFLKYGINVRQKEKYKLHYFVRVIKYFKQIGSASNKKRNRQSSKLEAATVRVQSEWNLQSSNQISVRRMAQKLDFSSSTVYKAMKFGCKLKPYKFHKSQLLTDDHKKQRAKFCGRAISRKAENPWPARSPDLNPLDYWFWGQMQQIVYGKSPSNLEDMKKIVNNAVPQDQPGYSEEGGGQYPASSISVFIGKRSPI